MASKKKLLTSVVALGTAAALTLGGTFAWQSISQSAVNEASDIVNPGGRLHNDQHWVSDLVNDTNIYVENFTEKDKGEDIYARVRLSEYMEVVMNYGVEGAEKVEIIAGDKEAVDADSGQTAENASWQDAFKYTYEVHDFVKDFAGDEENKNPTSEFFTWQHADEDTAEADLPYFMPTFNKNKDSVAADLNGEYADTLGGISNREKDQYDYEEITADTEAMTASAIYDADSDTDDELKGLSYSDLKMLYETGGKMQNTTVQTAIDEKDIILVEETHEVAQVGTTKGLISLSDWLALNNGTYSADTHGNYWVYDDSADGDGWVYWSSPIKAGETTGLLLDGFELKGVMDDTWYYAIDVEAQFVTANDVGQGKGTGFYDTTVNSDPSYKAEKLLKAIGVELEVSPKALTISDPKLTDRSDGGLIITATVEVNDEPAANTAEAAVKGYFGDDRDEGAEIVGTITDGTVTFNTDGHHFWQGRYEEQYLNPTLDFTIGYTDEDGDTLTSNTLTLKYAEELKLGTDGTGTITLTEDGLKRFAVTTSTGDVTPNITVSTADGSQLTENTDFEYDMFAGRLVIKSDSYVGTALTVAEYIEPKAVQVNFTHDGQSANWGTDFKVGVEDTLTVSFTNKWNQQIVDTDDVAAIMKNATFTLADKVGDTVTKGGEFGWNWYVDGSDVKITIDQDYTDKVTLSYSIPGYDGYGNEYTFTGEIELTPDFTDVYGAKEVNFLKLIPNDCNAGIPLNETYYLYLDQDDKGTKWITEDIFTDGTVTGTFDGFGVLTDSTLTFVSNDDGTYSGTCNGTTVCTVSCGDKRNAGITLLRGSRGTWCLTIKIDEQTYACRFTTAS